MGNMLNIWLTALYPASENFDSLLQEERTNEEYIKPALLWLLISGLFAGVVAALIQLPVNERAGYQPLYLVTAILSVLVLSVLYNALLFLVAAGAGHWLARMTGGRGNFYALAYCAAAYIAPVQIIAAIATVVIPLLAVLVHLDPTIPTGLSTGIILEIYMIMLQMTALQVVYGIGWGKSAIAALPLFLLLTYLLFA